MMYRDPYLGPEQPEPAYNPMLPVAPTPTPAPPMPQQTNTQTNRRLQDAAKRQSGRTQVKPVRPLPGDPPKNSNETIDDYNKRVKRHRGRTQVKPVRPLPGDPPKNSNETIDDYNKRVKRHRAGYPQDDVTQSSPNDRPLAPPAAPRDYFGEQRKIMEDLGMAELQPVAPGMATPQRPQVDESLLSRLPSRSEQDRSSMQPEGMVSGDTFDAMAAREREERLAAQRRLAQREDVTAEDNRGFTRTVDRDPNSPTFGQATVVGDPMFGPTVSSEVREFIKSRKNLSGSSAEAREMRRQLNEAREPRRQARLAGEVYIDPTTGAVTDYGKYDEYRQRLAEGPTLENMSDARKLRMRRAQLRNYGRTGGVTIAPGGGIAGPMTVGTQATFGPNMSLNQATLMAQNQLDEESRLRDAERRLQLEAEQKLEGDRLDRLAQLAPTNPAAADALAESLGIPKAPPSPEQVAANAQARAETESVINEGGMNKGMGEMHRRVAPNLTPEVTNEELDVLYEGLQLSPSRHLAYLEEQVAGMGMSEERAKEILERKRSGQRIPPGAEDNARNTLAQHAYLRRLREYVEYRQQS